MCFGHFCLWAKHDLLAKKSVLPLGAVPGMSNSLFFTCLFRFGLRGKDDLLVKNDTFGAGAIEFQVFYVLKTGG